METQEVSTEECDFCKIIHNESDTEILLSDNDLVCFRDSKPGAAHHYLVVSRTHVESCKSLQKDHVGLVEQMEEMGRKILEKNKVSDLEDISQSDELQVPHSLRASVSLVYHSRQSAFSIEDTWKSQMKNIIAVCILCTVTRDSV
ncbi:hypothetical protein LDENG_00014750 [Lucifuga dentata]|nr:hypothetical protein LDENG_00014750 [Lucifuga dentata]